MKTQHFLFMAFMSAGILFSACQKDDVASPNGGNAKVTFRQCDTTFTAALVCAEGDSCSKTVTFTFMPGDYSGPVVIQGGLTNKTEICEASSEGLVQILDHPATLHSKANVTRWEGEVEACGTYTVTITWSSTNNDPEVTGSWSAQFGEGIELVIEPLICP